MKPACFYVYILTNTYNTVMYVGMTNDLEYRVLQHRSKSDPRSFTARYNLWKLIYLEDAPEAISVIAREKEIKGWTRQKKIELIESVNPDWKDLFPGGDPSACHSEQYVKGEESPPCSLVEILHSADFVQDDERGDVRL